MVADNAAALLTSPLHERHRSLDAKLADFGGWSMPLEYTGAVTEHRAVRERVGVFDVSHLGKAMVSGPGAAAYVNACLTNDLGRIKPGQAQYTLCCTPEGGVVDDLIAYLRRRVHRRPAAVSVGSGGCQRHGSSPRLRGPRRAGPA
jgi:aminomethyltransferase